MGGRGRRGKHTQKKRTQTTHLINDISKDPRADGVKTASEDHAVPDTHSKDLMCRHTPKRPLMQKVSGNLDNSHQFLQMSHLLS